MAEKEAAAGSKLDVSQLRSPIQISGKPVEQVLSSIHYGSPELRCLLLDECDLIFECKVCRALFRDLPNFISHKRVYCTKSSMDSRHVTIASLPEEKVVIIQPQAPEETEKAVTSSNRLGQLAKTSRPNLEDTIQRIQSGELGRSHAYQVYTEAAEKLQRQKEGMKVATIRTTAIPTNKNAVFIDVNMASVNIHERQQQVNSGIVASYDQNDASVTVIKRKIGDRSGSAKNVRKSVRQEKHSSEPQKLLMEQLKEIQHKVKQKVAAAQDKAGQQKRVKGTPQNSDSDKGITSSLTNGNIQNVVVNPNALRVQKKTSNGAGLKIVAPENAHSLLVKEETVHVKEDSETQKGSYAVVKRRIDSKINSKSTKENNLRTSAAASLRSRKIAKRSLICSKCNSIFATRKSLGYHVKIHHSAKRTFYPCPYCPSVFYYFFAITRHLFRNHSKTLEEVDEMRRQLREKSFTKPFCVPSLRKETEKFSGSSRPTRTSGRNLMLSTSPSTCSRTDKPLVNDKQLLKRINGNVEIPSSEAPLKVGRQKSLQSIITHDETTNSPKPSGPTVNEKVVHTGRTYRTKKIKELHSIRLKNKKQQRVVGKSNISGDLVDASSEGSTVRSSHVSSSVSKYKETTSYACPKCRRAFRRKISCKNHLKVCKNEGGRTKRTMRSQNNGSRQGTPESTPSRYNLPIKVSRRTRTSSNDSAVRTTIVSSSHVASSIKIDEKKDPNVVNQIQSRPNTCLRPHDSRNTKLSPSDSTSSLSQRSSSVDRVLKRGGPRNRSPDRSSIIRDKRDSSVESTQSNVEGKSPRNRRNVLSRYAMPTVLSESPQKSDTLITDAVSDNEEKITSEVISQVDTIDRSLDPSDIFLRSEGKNCSIDHYTDDNNCKPEKESGDFKKDIQNLSEIRGTVKCSSKNMRHVDQDSGSTVLSSDHTNTKLMSTREIKRDRTLMSTREIKRDRTLHQIFSSPQNVDSSPQKSQKSPCKFNFSPRKPQQNNSASCYKNEFPHKQLGSADRSVLFQKLNLDLSLKSESSPSKIKYSVQQTGIPLNKSQENASSKTASTNTVKEKIENDHLKFEQIIKSDATDSKPSASNNSDRLRNSLMQLSSQIQENLDMPDGILQTENNATSVGMDMDLKHFSCLEDKQSEIVPEEISMLTLKNSSGSSKSKDKKPQAVLQKTVVSALSERPKRKRKVPSRNRDAEEMLSKMLSHDRQVIPGKRRKVTLEAKVTDSQKQKFKEGTIPKKTPSSDINDKRHENNNDTGDYEAQTPSREIELSEEDDNYEDDNDELGKTRGRFVSNRIYVLENNGSKRTRLKCYDQVKVYKYIDEENCKCLECGESCTLISNLRRHVIRQHLKWSRFKCKLCKFESYDRSECNTHIIRVHRSSIVNGGGVNHFIIDLVKKGSRARSLKKNETMKVKQQSESQEGNIYARPTLNKVLRLPQESDGEIKTRQKRNMFSKNRDSFKFENPKNDNQHDHNTEGFIPTLNTLISNSKQPSLITVSRKPNSTSTSPPKTETSSKQFYNHQTSPKPGLDHSADSKDVPLKASRKSLPFNISTRNSPRTFDTRPYNPENGDGDPPANTESMSISKPELLVKVSATENMSKTVTNEGDHCIEQLETIPPDIKVDNEFEKKAYTELNADSVHMSRNIFDKMRTQNTSTTEIVSPSCGNSEIDKSVSSNKQELHHVTSSVASETTPPRVLEVKIEGPLQVIEQPKHLIQVPGSTPTKSPSVNVQNSKTKVISYIIRGPPQKLQVSDEVVNADQLAKSLIKLKDLSDQQFSSPQTFTQPILKPAAKVSVSSQVITSSISQRKQTFASASSTGVVKTTEHITLAPHKTTVASKETPVPSSGMTLTAALTKSGCISTTVASSFMQGQAGKFIIYTRPVGAKDLTTEASLTQPLSSSSTTSPILKTSDPKPGSEDQETKTEESFPPGTIVIRKHYL